MLSPFENKFPWYGNGGASEKPMFLYINVYLFLFDITSFIYFASRSNINKIELSNKKKILAVLKFYFLLFQFSDK